MSILELDRPKLLERHPSLKRLGFLFQSDCCTALLPIIPQSGQKRRVRVPTLIRQKEKSMFSVWAESEQCQIVCLASYAAKRVIRDKKLRSHFPLSAWTSQSKRDKGNQTVQEQNEYTHFLVKQKKSLTSYYHSLALTYYLRAFMSLLSLYSLLSLQYLVFGLKCLVSFAHSGHEKGKNKSFLFQSILSNCSRFRENRIRDKKDQMDQ